MKAKALLVLSAIAMLGLASCSNGPETPVDSSEETSTSVEEPSSSSPEITETSSEDPVPEPVFYAVTDSIDDHVTIVGLPETAQEGDVITFRLAVDPGYEFLDVVLVKQGDNVVDLVKNENGSYTFTMPAGDVVITAEDQASVFGLNYHVDDGLTLIGYERVKNEDLLTEEAAAVAGIYEGSLATGSSYYSSSEDFRIEINAKGDIAVSDITSSGSIRYIAKGRAVIKAILDSEGAPTGSYSVTWDITDDITFPTTTYTTSRVDGSMTIKVEEKTTEPATPEEPGLPGAETPEEPVAPETTIVRTVTAATVHEIYGSSESTYKIYTSSDKLERVGDTEGVDGSGYSYFKLDHLPTCAEYLGKVYYKVPKTNWYEAESLTVNGVALDVNEDGYFVYGMPYHGVTINVNRKVRKSPIVVEGDREGVSATAYTREAVLDAEGTPVVDEGGNPVYEYTPVTEASYETKVYIKVNLPEGVTENYLNVQNGPTDWDNKDSGATPGVFVKNADGYIEVSSGVMNNMDFGIKISVHTLVSAYEEGDAHIVSASKAIKVDGSGTTVVDFAADDSGRLLFGKNEETGVYGKNDTYFYNPAEAPADGTLSLTRLGDSSANKATKHYAASFHNGIYVINTSNYSQSLDNFYIAGGDLSEEGATLTKYARVSSSKAVFTVTVGGEAINGMIGDFDEATGTDEEGVNHDALSVKWGITITNLTGAAETDSVWAEDGTVFDAIDVDGTLLGTFARKGLTISDYQKGVAGTFTGAGETLVSNGVGKVTYGGLPVYASANGEVVDGKGTMSFVVADEGASTLTLYVVSIDTETKTYTAISGKPFAAVITGNYYGAKIAANSSTGKPELNSYYKFGVGSAADKGAFAADKAFWESSSYSWTLAADGSITLSNGYAISFSPEGKVGYAVSSSMAVVASRNINAYNASARDVKSAKIADKTYLVELIPTTATYGENPNEQMILRQGTGTAFDLLGWTTATLAEGSAEGAKWYTSGVELTYVNEQGRSVTVTNDGGVLVENVDGTYTTADGVSVVVAGNTVTIGETAYEMERADLTYSHKAMVADETGNKLVTTVVVLNPTDMSATVTVTELAAGVEGVDYTVNGSASASDYAFNNDAAAGTWTSSNAGKGSSKSVMSITAVSAGVLTFHYTVSSETKWDGMIIKVNGTALSGWSNKADHSGEMSGDVEIELAEGDVVTISYEKDSSGDGGSDQAFISSIVFLA